MPVTVRKRRELWRVVEVETGQLVRNSRGEPVDGGGYPSKSHAEAQARAINASKGDRGHSWATRVVRRR